MSLLDIYIVTFLIFGSIFFSVSTIKRFVNFNNFSGLSNNLGNLQTVRSIFAQYISSFSLLSIIQYVYLTREQFILAMIGDVLGFFLCYFFFSKKILKNNKKSLYELIGYYYGGDIRFLFSCGELLSNAFFVCAHLKLMSEILKIFKISPDICNLIIFFITFAIIIFASFEESKTNYFNVFIEFLFFLLIPFICVYFWNNLCYSSTFENFDMFSLNNMDLKSCFSTKEVTFVTLAIVLRFFIPFCDSTYYHSVLICKDKKVDRLHLVSGFFIMFYFFLMIMLGVFIYASNSSLRNDQIFEFFFKNLPIGIKGIFLSAVVILTFSSCVKTVQSLSIILLNDIVPCEKLFINKNEFKNILLSNVFIGVSVFLISLTKLNYFTLFLYGSIGMFPLSVVSVGLTLSGVRPHKNCVYVSVIMGLFSTLISILVLQNTEYCKFCFFPGFICSLLGFIVSYIYYKYVVGYKWNGIEPEDLDKKNEDEILKQKINVLLNKSKSNLVLFIKNITKNRDLDNFTDSELIKEFIKNSEVRSSLEYKIFKGYIFKYVLKKNCDLNDPNLDNDQEFVNYIKNL